MYPIGGIYPVVSKNGIYAPGHLEKSKIRYLALEDI
jgi:hypothetical protein